MISTLDFTITDAQARSDWSRLLGFDLRVPNVVVTAQFYREHCAGIQIIQFAAALRAKGDPVVM